MPLPRLFLLYSNPYTETAHQVMVFYCEQQVCTGTVEFANAWYPCCHSRSYFSTNVTQFSGRLWQSPCPSLTRNSPMTLSFIYSLVLARVFAVNSPFSLCFLPMATSSIFSSLLNLFDYLKFLVVPLAPSFSFNHLLSLLPLSKSALPYRMFCLLVPFSSFMLFFVF